MATWPSQLQQKLNARDFQIQPTDTSITTEMDYGPAKKRKRYTDAIDNISCSIRLPFADYSILDTFYKTTLSGGSLPFDFTHPITQATVKVRFKGPPTYSPLGNGGIELNVAMSWEILP